MANRIDRWCMLLLLVTCTFFSAAHAQELVAIPALNARVIDLTQTLDEIQKNKLEEKLAALEQKKGSQISLLIIPTTQPEDIVQYASRVVAQWKIGREEIDDGVLFLIAKNDHKMRIEVGYGLEGAIPDVFAKRIISDIVAPYFKKANYAQGIDAGVNQLIQLVEGETLPEPKADMQEKIAQMLPLLIFGGLVSGLMLRSIFGTLLGSAFNGGIVGTAIWVIGLTLSGAVMLGFIAFFLTMMLGTRGFNQYGGYPSGGNGGSNWRGGSSTGWSGGGGDFGGGGASGDW